jgi:hypothetical protein
MGSHGLLLVFGSRKIYRKNLHTIMRILWWRFDKFKCSDT